MSISSWAALAGLWSLAMLSACSGSAAPTPPSTDTDTDPPVCTTGAEVEVEVLLLDEVNACFVGSVVPVTCDAIRVYLEGYEEDPPVFPCTPEALAIAELATGDCLLLFTRCPGVLDDPRYGDCSAADDDRCCAIHNEQSTISTCPAADP